MAGKVFKPKKYKTIKIIWVIKVVTVGSRVDYSS